MLIGGQRIVREAIRQMIESEGVSVVAAVSGESTADHIQRHADQIDAIVLFVTEGPFTTFQRIGETLSHAGSTAGLVVLSAGTTRGQVYAALRIGAKGYVNLDADPEELKKAIEMVAANKVHLSPDAAELLISDVSGAQQTVRAGRIEGFELSRREVQIVQLLCEGLSAKEIARRLHISAKTVDNHRYNIYRKCGVESIAGLIRHAIHHGLVNI